MGLVTGKTVTFCRRRMGVGRSLSDILMAIRTEIITISPQKIGSPSGREVRAVAGQTFAI